LLAAPPEVTTGAYVVVVLVGAIVIDAAFGDPPNRWHPVAWLGVVIEAARRRLAHGSPIRLLATGALVTFGVAAIAAASAALVLRATLPLGAAAGVVEALVCPRAFRCVDCGVPRRRSPAPSRRETSPRHVEQCPVTW
jgi:cobalamin biosynthesis protein CobD/CbiB